MKKVLFIFILTVLIISEITTVFIARIKFYPDLLFSHAVKLQKKNDFEKAEEYYRKADKAGSIHAKCAMFMMIYENVKDEEKLKVYKDEYKAEKKQCKSFALEGTWDD